MKRPKNHLGPVLLLILLALAACGSQPSERASVAFGTYNADALGLAVLLEFDLSQTPSGTIPVSLSGPPGWNDDEPVVLEAIFLGNEPKRKSKIFTTFADTPVSGTYTVSFEANHQFVRASAELDASTRIAKPENVWAASNGLLASVRWDPVPGAELYEVVIVDKDAAGDESFVTARFTLETSVDLPVLDRPGLQHYARVYAMTYTFVDRQGVPEQFDVSGAEVPFSEAGQTR